MTTGRRFAKHAHAHEQCRLRTWRQRRRGAHRCPPPGTRIGIDARLHAGRNGRDRQSDAAGVRRRNRRRYRARQHLSSDAAARRRAHRETRRLAQIHELAAADPDRFRRLSGDVAVQPAQDTEEGVRFRSHIDGSEHFFSPERAMEIQRLLGSDIQMVLDECPAYPASEAEIEISLALSMRWAKRSKAAFGASGRRLFRHRAGRRLSASAPTIRTRT